MTSLSGITQAYNGLASTYLALAPNCGDKIFGTDINYCDLVQWGIYDGQENDPKVLAMYDRQRKASQNSVLLANAQAVQTTSPTSYSWSPSNSNTTVLSILDQLPQASTFRKLVYKSGWDKYVNSANDLYKVTLFAPINEAFMKDGWQNISLEGWNKNNLRSIAQAHTLPFAFEQEQAYNRKLQLTTSLETFNLYVDGTGEVRPTVNFYIPPNKMLELRYPKPLQRIEIIQAFYTNNGALYLIDGIFDPDVIVY